MKNSLFVFLSCIVFLSCQEKKDLHLELEKGSKYYQNYTVDLSISQSFQGQTMDMAMTMVGKTSFLVNEASADAYDLKVQFENLVMKMQTPMGEMEFNSAKNDDGDPFSSILSKMANHSFDIKMNKKGAVQEVQNMDEMFDKMFSDIPEMEEDQKQQLMEQLENTYGEEAFKTNFELGTNIFPDKEVAVGDTWEKEFTINSNGVKLFSENKYTLKEYGGENAVIECVSNIKTVDGEGVEANGMMMNYSMEGTSNSTLKINSKTGWVIEGDIDQHLKGDLEFEGSPEMPGGMKMPMEMSTKMKITDK